MVTDALATGAGAGGASDGSAWVEVQPAPCSSLLWWDLLWTWSRPKIAWEELLSFQRVNHFPNAREISRKDHLKRNLCRLRNIPGKIGDAFDIFPATFTLPHE